MITINYCYTEMIGIWIDYRHTDMLKLELAVTWQ